MAKKKTTKVKKSEAAPLSQREGELQETQSAAPQEAAAATDAHDAPSLGEGQHDLYADVRAQREARRKRSGVKGSAAPADTASPAGHVRHSTLWLAVGLALACGLFIGSLLPGLMHAPAPGGDRAQAPAGQAPSQDAAVRLAGHILELEEAVRKNPEDVQAWVQLGNLYFDSDKAPQAINAYERALLLKPDDANVLTDLGVMYRNAGKFELAVQSFRKATQVDPKHQNAIFNRGVVLYFDLQRKEEGRKAWQELLAVNPQAKAPDGRPLKDMLRDLK